jgi:hypothetical protein
VLWCSLIEFLYCCNKERDLLLTRAMIFLIRTINSLTPVGSGFVEIIFQKFCTKSNPEITSANGVIFLYGLPYAKLFGSRKHNLPYRTFVLARL